MHRSSGFNALTLVSSWLLLCVAIPATLTAVLNVIYPIDAKTDLTAAVQQANARVFATPKPALAAQFYRMYPAYNTVARDTFPDGWYNPRWVRAMHLLLDRAVKPYDDAYHRQVASRIQLADRFDYCSPAILTQSIYNRLTASDMQQMLAYDTGMYQRFAQWRDYLDKLIYTHHNRMTQVDFDHLPRAGFTPFIDYSAIWQRLLGLGVICLSLIGLSGYLLSRHP